jgi:bisphosphoglycerate-dependent phosphoglycerate mutase
VVRVLTNIILKFDYSESSSFNLPNGIPLIIDLDSSLNATNWQILADGNEIEKKMKKI